MHAVDKQNVREGVHVVQPERIALTNVPEELLRGVGFFGWARMAKGVGKSRVGEV
jgi:hypothetical protein